MTQIVLTPVPQPFEGTFLPVFGWLRAPKPPRSFAIKAFDKPVEHELHARADLQDLFPETFSTGFYAVVDVAQVSEILPAADYRIPISVVVNEATLLNDSISIAPGAIDRARSGPAFRRTKRKFVLDHAACSRCGSRLTPSGSSATLTCPACHAEFPQRTNALNLKLTQESVPKLLNTSLFGYSDIERSAIEYADHCDGFALDFGAGLRDAIEPRVITLEIADYPTTDVISDGNRIPFVDGTFDAAIALHVLEHVREPWTIARELARVLKPGGLLVATVPFISAEHGFPNHFFNMTRSGLLSLFDGLTLEHQFIKGDGVPINAVQQVLSSYWGTLAEPVRSRFGAMTVDALVRTPLSELVMKDFAVELPEHAKWKTAAHTSIVMRKPK